ncbi:MAG TPA: restriction endonuclease subunit S, partial [Terriglobia bacterium]|nr:restriction endonuclease subunit S [Terriglobia bacterium]
AAEARIEAAKDLPAAYLRAVFSSSEAQKWPKRPLVEVGEIVSGITLGRKLKGAKTRLVPYLRVANVKDAYLDLSNVYKIEATETEIEKCRLRDGDLLLTEGGDPDKLGRGTFWEGQIAECIHQNHIFRVRFELTEISSQFISAQMASVYGKRYFLAHAKQTTGIATINQKVLGGFPLLLPTLTDQRRVTSMLNQQVASAARARKAIEEELETINKLPAALLRRAFAGQL